MLNKTVSFLASGRGSNFEAVAKKIKSGEIKADLGILISDKKDAKALKLANDFGMKSFFVDPKKFSSREEFDREMVVLFKKAETDLVVAAGYMRILSPVFINNFKNKIINIHPALLPAFPGIYSQKKALDYGVKITGCTAHFVDEGTDTGPIIIQAFVPVLPDDTEDTLSARILKEEHRIFPDAVNLFCKGKLKVKGRIVSIG
jgi:phosphoribosylglycinamide formyltransferase-1